jgi:DNA gyrase subunit A
VRMAQDFQLRYPLVDGHGNFGSIDGDSPAAMRYTEARLQLIAVEFLDEIRKQTVHYRPNYDGTLSEPVVLPSRIPNLLVNGTSGIAVGMATNIPPHNLTEVLNGLEALVADPEIDVEALCAYIRGPDFPTAGRILNTDEELLQIYRSGDGAILLRGEYRTEKLDGGRTGIIIYSIP